MSYNLTSIAANSSDLVTFTQGVNNVLMQGYLGVFLLIGLSIVILIGFIQGTGDVKKSITATSFITFLLSLFLIALNLIPTTAFYIVTVVAGLAIALSWKQ